jgi:hypothetical protein
MRLLTDVVTSSRISAGPVGELREEFHSSFCGPERT